LQNSDENTCNVHIKTIIGNDAIWKFYKRNDAIWKIKKTETEKHPYTFNFVVCLAIVSAVE
jgi:hypothetical protein